MVLQELLRSIPFIEGIPFIMLPVFVMSFGIYLLGPGKTVALEIGVGSVLGGGAFTVFYLTGEFRGSLEFLYFGLFYTVWPLVLAGVIFHSRVHPDKDITAKYVLLGWGATHFVFVALEFMQVPFDQVIFHGTWPPFFGYTLLMLGVVPLTVFLGAGMYYSGQFRELPSSSTRRQ